MKVLHIVESAYRATLEEQDDTVLWLVQVLLGAGAELAVLLQGSAVSYVLRNQDASGIAFGGWRQTRSPNVEAALTSLIRDGVPVYAIEEDIVERGIREHRCIGGVRQISRARMPELFAGYDQVWQW
jgi:sulfur relay (sulfurtransferase) DsrF/TusC family protein